MLLCSGDLWVVAVLTDALEVYRSVVWSYFDAPNVFIACLQHRQVGGEQIAQYWPIMPCYHHHAELYCYRQVHFALKAPTSIIMHLTAGIFSFWFPFHISQLALLPSHKTCKIHVVILCRSYRLPALFRVSVTKNTFGFPSSPRRGHQAKAERERAQAKALRDSGIHMTDVTAPMAENPNRGEGALGDDADWASGIDAALGNLSIERGAGPIEKHPERRLKAVSEQLRYWC